MREVARKARTIEAHSRRNDLRGVAETQPAQ